ncbi:MAG: ATP-dependent DNA ligase [Deinococcota bacterium]
MKQFVELFRAVDGTTATNTKVAALKDYFLSAPPEDAIWALYLLTGKLRKRTLTSRALRNIFLEISDLPEWLVKDAQAHVGDTSEAVALLVQATEPPLPDSGPLELPLHEWLEQEIPKAKHADDDAKRELVLRWWASLDGDSLLVLHKMLSGNFRIGVSNTLVTRALAEAFERTPAEMTHRLMGDFPTTAEFYRSLAETSDGPVASQPYPFLLAYPVELDVIAEEGLDQYRLEWKWDGIRAQLIKREGEVFIWSRGEDLITTQFPELAEAFVALPDGTVLDGEIVAWWDGQIQSFNDLQKRLGRKKVGPKVRAQTPVHYLIYDLLEDGGQDIREMPLQARREKLEALIATHPITEGDLTQELYAADVEVLEQLRHSARDAHAEGLMLKRLDSPYLVGRRKGLWWKHKVDPYTLDAVLIYAQAGTGRRANLFTDYTFALWRDGELVSFTKAYSGLDDGEIAKLDRWIRRNTIERFGPVRSVKPEQVFELAFEGIAESSRHKSGIAVRFPRILRWRDDKPPAEADSLETARALLDAN